MEELSKIAKAYYQASTDHLQKLAHDFFSAMDHDGDGKIDLREFLEFMKEEGHSQMIKWSVFYQLDIDGNGTLDFFEVMTLYYIIKSGRPFCDHCNKLITSTYFKCVGCLEGPDDLSYHLCLDCYITQKCGHTHDDLSRFVDNYSLLEVMTNLKLGEPRSSMSRSRPFGTDSISVPVITHSGDINHTWNPSLAMVPVPQQPLAHTHQWSTQGDGPSAPIPSVVHNHTWIQNNYSFHHPPPHYVHPPAPPHHVPVIPQRQQWQTALAALNAAVQISTIGSSLCSIL